MESYTMRELEIGQSASLTRTITEEDVYVFAEFTEDLNPIHLDEAFAKTTKFGKRIAHGLLVSTMIGSVLGQQLPGNGSVYVSQTLNFKAPVFIDDTITCTLTITGKDVERNRLTLSAVSINQDGVVVLDGVAVILPPKEKQ